MRREAAPHAETVIGNTGRAAIGLPPGPRRRAAFAIGLAVFISVLDSVMVNVALPSIARDLAVDPASAIWVVNAYQLAAALVLLPLGSAADRFGHRRIYLGCLVMFMIGMIGCALSRDLVSLAACRFVQGCGGAGLLGLTNAMLRFTYPPDSLPRGIAINSFIVALTLASGPTISSLIVELANWRWLFLVGVPIGAFLLLFGGRHLPLSTGSGRGLDLSGAAISMATVGLLILAIDAQAHSQGVAIPILLLVAGLSAAIVLVRHQMRTPTPIVPVDLLRTRMFGLSIGVVFGAAAAQIMAYVSLPFLFQHDLGRTQIETGLLFLPWPIALACIAPLTGRLGGRYAPGILCSIGLGIFAVGLAALATLEPGATNWDIGWRMAVCGIGYGFYQPPSSRAIIMSAPIERAGSASTMGATGRLLGQATGAALVASLFRLLPDDARQIALLVAAAIAVAALVASAARGFRFETESFE